MADVPPLRITPDIAASFQRRLENASDDEALKRVVRDAAKYGVDWSHMLYRAKGGKVKAGRAFIVGEKGPEMFVPQASGKIIPNRNRNMAVLTAAARKAVPKSQFGIVKPAGPRGGVESELPMPDATHAVNAKGRAKQMLKRGRISRAQYEGIIAKANRRIVQLSGG